MSETSASLGAGLERAREAYEETAEQLRDERRALELLRSMVAALADESVRLHQRNMASIESMKEDLERVKRRLKRLATARS